MKVGGRSDAAPLTEKGERQAEALGRRLRDSGVKFDRVYCSTAERARRTAQLACKELGFDPSLICESRKVLELCMGEWTGRRRAEVYTPDVLQQIQSQQLFFRAPGFSERDAPEGGPAPAGESQLEVEERMASFVDGLLLAGSDAHHAAHGGREPVVAIFSHGLAIRCLLRRLLGAHPGFAVHSETKNTAISDVWYKAGGHNLDGWFVASMNDAAHLQALDK